MRWKAHLHGHGKERKGTTADGGTQTPSPSSSQAHHRRACSPVVKPSCWGYPHCTYVYTYFPLTDLLPDQPEKGTWWWHWCFFCLRECWVCLSVSICVARRVDPCTAYMHACACVPTGNNTCSASLLVGLRAWSCAASPLSGYQIQHLPYVLYKHLSLPSKKKVRFTPI